MRRSEPVSVAAGAAAVGGLVAFVGVYLGWFSVTAPAGSGSFGGTADWTGLVAAIAGLLAVVGGGAAVLLRGGVLGTWGAGLASVGGIFAAAMATIALLRLDAVAAETPAMSRPAAPVGPGCGSR